MRPIPWLSVVVSLVAGLATPATAGAHYEDNGNLMFRGFTQEPPGGRSAKIDPINLFIYPYATTSTSEYERFDTHFEAHWRPGWKKDSEMTNLPLLNCKNDQGLGFRRAGPSGSVFVRFRTDHQGVGFKSGPIPRVPYDCINRYHVRLWKDSHAHNEGPLPHEPSTSWFAAGIHYDRLRPRLSARICRDGPLRYPCLNSEGFTHYTGQDWDMVEWIASRKMARQRSSGHLDYAGRRGGHCFKYRWRAVPGGEGYFGSPRMKSDGFITRISMGHCAPLRP